MCDDVYTMTDKTEFTQTVIAGVPTKMYDTEAELKAAVRRVLSLCTVTDGGVLQSVEGSIPLRKATSSEIAEANSDTFGHIVVELTDREYNVVFEVFRLHRLMYPNPCGRGLGGKVYGNIPDLIPERYANSPNVNQRLCE